MKKWWLELGVIALLLFGLRLFFAFQTPYLSSDSSYLHVRIADSLVSGNLLREDNLGFGGRSLVISPLFDVVIAFFSLFMPLDLAVKIIPNLFASLLVFPAFLLCFSLSKNKSLSLAGAVLASIVPGFFAKTFNHLSPLTITIPLFFLLLYWWIERRIIPLLAGLVLFAFLHPLSLVFVLSMFVYVLLLYLEKIENRNADYEIWLFAVVFTLWVQFVLYKEVIVNHGFLVIWQNIPGAVFSNWYSDISILGAIFQIGIYPLFEGVYALYRTAFSSPNRSVLALLSTSLVSAFLLWLKLIDVSTGVILLGISLAVLFAKWTDISSGFIKKTRFAKRTSLIVSLSIIVALLTTAYPAYAIAKSELSKTLTVEEVSSLNWLKENSNYDSIIIAPVQYGHIVASFAKRKTVIDSYFLLQEDTDVRYADVDRIMKTAFETEAVELFDKYSASYLFIPASFPDIKYGDGKCFEKVNTHIYKKNDFCRIRVIS